MSLARAFTTMGRRRARSDDHVPTQLDFGRNGSKRGGRPSLRDQISSPITLVSTSNMQVHDAQNIIGTTPIEIRQMRAPGSPQMSVNEDDSDTSAVFSTTSNDANTTDASSIDESPMRESTGPEPNHLSCYFKPTVDTTAPVRGRTSTTTSSARPSMDESTSTPKIPQRVPSHSKQAHERLHRKRSLQRMISPAPTSRRAVQQEAVRTSIDALGINAESTTTTSAPVFAEAPRDTNPFGKELAQLDEVAEEFNQVVASAQRAELDPEAEYLAERGLARFDAADYALEIQELVFETFGTDPAVPAIGESEWI